MGVFESKDYDSNCSRSLIKLAAYIQQQISRLGFQIHDVFTLDLQLQASWCHACALLILPFGCQIYLTFINYLIHDQRRC